MTQASQSGNVFLDILNNHGDTLQQLSLLAYLSKGEEAKPFLQATTAAKVILDWNQSPIQIYQHWSTLYRILLFDIKIISL